MANNVFHHHPDDRIFIRTYSGETLDEYYEDTLENFNTDMTTIEETYSGLPDGKTERYYEVSVKHKLKTRVTDFPQSLPWTEGNNIISNITSLISAKAAREAE